MEEARKKQELEDAKLAERLQADENSQDGSTTTPHLLHAVLHFYQPLDTLHLTKIVIFR